MSSSLFGVVELLTLSPRQPERAFELTESGLGVLSHDPLPAGRIVLAVLGLPDEGRAHEVIVRVVWSAKQAMGLEFLLPDDALVAAIGRLRGSDRFSHEPDTERSCAT